MMRAVRQALLTALVAAVVAVPIALAANGEPRHAFTNADQARAKAASLKLADFGPGWKARISASSDSHPRCSTYNPNQSDLVETGKYDSPDFTRTADNSFVSVSTGIFKTAAMAKTGYGRVASPKLPACFGELFAKGIKKPNSAKVISAREIRFPRVADRSNAYRLIASVKTPSVTVPITADIVLFNRGRADVAIIFLGIAKPLPLSFEVSAVDRVLSRLR
jgi:hypothetical protein